jgi:hypothetical protein
MTLDRRVVPFKAWHYDWLRSTEAAEGPLMRIDDRLLRELEGQNWWTGVVDGAPIVCAGTMQQWPGRHLAFAYVAKGTLPHLPWISEQVMKNLAGLKGRIEFTVRADFAAGLRWAKRLGFEVETPVLKAFGPQGEDHVGFVRIN